MDKDIQVRLNGLNCRQRMYFNMTYADTASTGDFNIPVIKHVKVTFHICLTVYADPSTQVVRCARVVNELA